MRIARRPGVLYADTYGAMLERRFKEQRPGRKFQIINVGMAGLNTEGIVNRFENLGLRYDPDLVIYGYTLNDIEGPAYRKSAEDAFTNPNAYRDSPLHLLRLLGPRWRSLTELLWSPRGSYRYELDDNHLRNAAAMQQLHDGLSRLGGRLERRGQCGVVLIHTQLWSLNRLHPFRRHYGEVRRISEEHGFHAIDTHPLFTERVVSNASQYWIAPNNSHPNAAGHELFSQALWAGLEELPMECWSRKR